MPIQVLMPALSPTMTEGNLIKWHKKEGDVIKPGQVLAEIETDKATMEVEAVDEGIMGKILIAAGTDNVLVNQLIALILEEGEDASALDAIQTITNTMPISEPKVEEITPKIQQVTAQTASKTGKDRLFVTPLAKRIADQNSIDLKVLAGSGPNGRIIKADVEAAASKGNRSVPKPLTVGGYTDINLNGMRKVIAKRLTESKQSVPHFYLSIDCELDALMVLRQQLNGHPKADVKLSVNDFIVRACALALIEVPEANATWHDTYIRLYDNADISVAVAVDGGLVTPVVRTAEQKSIMDISLEVKSLAERARAGKLLPEEYQGGSFTLSNLGMFGIKSFSAILNPPQACILAVGAGEQQVVVKNGQMVIANVMTCTLSVDHRAVDGAVGSKFLAAFKRLIESPIHLFV